MPIDPVKIIKNVIADASFTFDDEDTDPIGDPAVGRCRIVPQLQCDGCGACGQNKKDECSKCPDSTETKGCCKPTSSKPKDNQGRATCYKCGKPTKKIPAFFSFYDVCPHCKI
jgi:hypothetical protein